MPSKTNTTWPQKPLSEVVDLNPRLDKSVYRDDLEVSFVPMAAVEAGTGRMDVVQTKSFGSVKKGYTPFKEGDVLFAKITPCMENGKMTVVPKLTNGLGFGSTEFHVLRPHEGIDPRYVYYFVSSQNFRREAAHQMTGAVGQKRVTQFFLEEASIPVPLLEDQRRIVAEIEKQFSRLDEAVASLKRTKANLKRYKAAVEGKLTEDWRKQHPNVEPTSKLLECILAERRAKWDGKGKYKEPVAPISSDLPSLPRGWTGTAVDQIVKVLHGKVLDQNKQRSGRLVPYLRNINIRWRRIDTDDLPEMFFDEDELDRYGLVAGDVFVCEGGKSGRAAVWDGRVPQLKYQKALHRIRFHGDFEARYFVSLLEFLANTGRLDRWFTGSTIKHFTRESFVSVPIPTPPLVEQREIVAEVERRLSVIEELEATVEANLTRADRLRQSILSQTFSGKLVFDTLRERSA